MPVADRGATSAWGPSAWGLFRVERGVNRPRRTANRTNSRVQVSALALTAKELAFSREGTATSSLDLDRTSLAAKLVRRRQAAGLSQAELARRAGIRPETLNRIERGRTTPDFATVRKLVSAMTAAELEGTDF